MMKASVILPCYNKARLLPLCLAALKNQSFNPKDFEVIIVDDGSTDATADVVRRRLWESARLLPKPNGGRSAARNYGASSARGSVIIFSDPDMVVCPGFVASHVALHPPGSRTVAIGAKKEMLAHLPWWLPARPCVSLLRQLRTYHPYRYRKVLSLISSIGWTRQVISERQLRERFAAVEEFALPATPDPPANFSDLAIPWVFLFSGNFSLLAETFQQSGAFDEHFSGWGLEDLELGFRLHTQGAHFHFEPDALSYHQTHAFSISEHEASMANNLRYFAAKHPCPEVLLYAAYANVGMTLEQYGAMVREQYTEHGALEVRHGTT